MTLCRSCLTEKPPERFRKNDRLLCKDCHNASNRDYRARRKIGDVLQRPQRTPEEQRRRFLEYQSSYKKRPDVAARNKEWASRPENREKARIRGKKHYKANKERWLARARYRWKHDPIYKLRKLVRGRFWLAVKGKSIKGSGVRNLGCDVPSFKAYIERLFKPGMTWENWGEWHLDHIKPLAAFDLYDDRQLLRACHYTNFQPLWATENLRKGAVYAQ